MLLSIIMPAYNSEKTLGPALDSVLAQSSADWELIIVDDNSADGTLRLAEEYGKKDGRIKIVRNNVNMGPAAARNSGIDIAQGDYIGFLDSDDTLHKDFAARMTATAAAHDADIVWCQYTVCRSSGVAEVKESNGVAENTPLNAKAAAGLFFKDTPGVGCLWNKIYARRIFAASGGMRLNPQRVRAEDWEFNLEVFRSLRKLVVIGDFLYNYCHSNKNSVMSSFRKEDYELMWRSLNLLEAVNEEMSIGKSRREIINIKGDSIIEYVYRAIMQMPYSEVAQIFREARFREYLDHLEMQYLPPAYRILATLLKYGHGRAAFLLFRMKARLLD